MFQKVIWAGVIGLLLFRFGPQPSSHPAPGPFVQGLHVLVKEDVTQVLPMGQVLEIGELKAGEIRELLKQKCAQEPNGPAVRVWDKTQDVSHETKYWQDASPQPP